MNVARSIAIAQMAFALGPFGTLVALHVTSDFSVANVYENSHSLKPLIYKVTGVWGNNEGSMLLWVLILALFGGLVAAFGNNLPLSLRAQEQRAHRFDEGRRRRLDRRVHRNPRRHRPAAGTELPRDGRSLRHQARRWQARRRHTPSKRNFTTRGSSTTEAALLTRGVSQLYISLGDSNADGSIAVHIYHKPLVLLIWLGAVVMAFGGLLSLSDRRLRVGAPKPAKASRALQPAE
jgi:cytochrome c biogenesis factor